METLEQLARILRRTDCSARQKALRDDVSNALASGRATDAEILEMIQRAVDLRIVRNAEAIL